MSTSKVADVHASGRFKGLDKAFVNALQMLSYPSIQSLYITCSLFGQKEAKFDTISFSTIRTPTSFPGFLLYPPPPTPPPLEGRGGTLGMKLHLHNTRA